MDLNAKENDRLCVPFSHSAGDFVKFGLPMASSVTLLAWGMIEYRDAYNAAGELANGLDCIKWPLDYFIKAHIADNKFYGQVRHFLFAYVSTQI